jgi:hypothetical protein
MPRHGVDLDASEAYVRGIDTAISDHLERLLGTQRSKTGTSRAEFALLTRMGEVGIPTAEVGTTPRCMWLPQT